jgi:hypothetical protein
MYVIKVQGLARKSIKEDGTDKRRITFVGNTGLFRRKPIIAVRVIRRKTPIFRKISFVRLFPFLKVFFMSSHIPINTMYLMFYASI